MPPLNLGMVNRLRLMRAVLLHHKKKEKHCRNGTKNVGGSRIGIASRRCSILGNIVILTAAALPNHDKPGLSHLFVSCRTEVSTRRKFRRF